MLLLLVVEIRVLTGRTSNRRGSNQTPGEIMPKPPVGRSETTPWPFWPLQLKHLLHMRKVVIEVVDQY
jgi:hypothetical protein